MTLSLALLVCLFVTAVVAVWSWRAPARLAWARTPAVVLTPLALLIALARGESTHGSGYSLQVIGQYAFLLDTVRVGSGPQADVRIPAPSQGRGAVGSVTVHFAPEDSSLVIRAGRGAPPAFVDGAIVGATPLGRAAAVRVSRGNGSDAVQLDVRMPWWPLGCTTRVQRLCGDRVLRGAGVDARVRVSENGVWNDAMTPGLARFAPFVLFRRNGSVYAAAGRGAELRVEGIAANESARARSGVVEIGLGRETARLRVVTDRQTNRLNVLYTGRMLGERWPLHAGVGRSVHRITYVDAPSPGTLPLLDLSVFPLGPNARDYAGALEWSGGGWRWHGAGVTRPIGTDRAVMFPGSSSARGEHGHLVRIAEGLSADGTLARFGILWLLGALLLASRASAAGGAVPALRVAVLGLAYTLVMVRATVAVRVAHAEPFNGEALPTTIVLLVVLPVLVWILEGLRSRDLVGGTRAARRLSHLLRHTRVAALDAHSGTLWTVAQYSLVTAVAAAVVYVVAGGIDRALFTAFIVMAGTAGLLVLQRLLVPRDASGSVPSGPHVPLSMYEIGAERGFASRHLVRAVSTLLVLVVLYIALALSLRGIPPYLSVTLYAVALAAVYAAAEVRGRTRARLSAARHRLIVRASALLGAGGGFIGALAMRPEHYLLAAAAAVVGAGALASAAYMVLLPLQRSLRAWPYRRSDILPPLWFALTPVFVLGLAQWGAVRRLGITLGFALALAGLLLVVRVFTVLWHQETKERVDAHLRESTPPAVTPRRTPLFAVLALTVYAGYLGADRGLMLLLFTSVLVTLVIAGAMLGPRRMLAAAAVLVLALGGVARWLHVPSAELATRPVALSTPQVRYASVRHPEALERQMLVARTPQAREIVSTLQQDWGMRAYAAAGRTWGNGLYGTQYTRRAISEDVALTDNAYAVFILSEHGFVGGALLLGVYLALALVLLGSAVLAGRSVSEVPRGILLGGLAMYVAVPALYMAAANVSLLPLTGQNMPLLGLRSGADVAFAAWTLALAVIALPRAAGGARGVTERAELNRRAMRRLSIILATTAAALVVLGGVVVRAVYRATHREGQPFQLAAFADGLRAAVERADIAIAGDSIVAGPPSRGKLGFRSGDFVLATIDRANAFSADRAEYRSHCVERSPWLRADASGVQVLDAPCKVDAPVGTGASWRGELRTASVPDTGELRRRDLVLASGAAAVVFAADVNGTARVACRDTSIAFADRAELTCGPGARLLVRRTAKGLVADVAAPGAGITKNGLPLASGERLRGGDILAVDSTSTWVVDEAPRAALAFARERNGQSARTVMPGTTPLFARLDSLLTEGLQLGSRTADADVALTIDVPTMDALQRGVERRCAEAASQGVRQCSAMLVDVETGDVLALAGWARPGVRVGRFAPLDANFRNHRAASTVKPFIAAAVLNEYPALRTLVVDHPGERFATAAGWPLGSTTPMKSELHNCPRLPVAWDCFLPTSNNLYAVTLGLLGAAERGSDGLPALRGTAEGPWYAINGRRMTQRPRFAMRDGRRSVAQSPLAQQLTSLFDAQIGRETGMFDQSLWRAMTERRLLRVTSQWQRVSPDVPQLPLDGAPFSDLRYLAGFMIGENENDWSNAALVRAMTRVMTGRGVELRLVHRVGDSVLAPIEKPGVRFGPGRGAVLDGMRGVVRGYGTAARVIGPMFASPGFEFFGKTGTLESQRFEPLSLFLFGGRDTRDARGPSACPVAGIVYVELERGAPERLTGVSLFADVVAPTLRARYGWSEGTSCIVKRHPPTPGAP